MIRSWFAAHRSAVLSATSGTLVAAVVAAAAVLSTGYTAQRVDLNDASVWVASGTRQAVARANAEVLTLDTVVESAGTELEVVQQGARVIVVDRGSARADVLDPASASVAYSVALPPEGPTVWLAGDNVVVHELGSGRVWTTPWSLFSEFDPGVEADLTLGPDALVTVDAAGRMFTFSPSVATVSRVDATAASAVQESRAVDPGEGGDEFQLSSSGGRWALLNLDSGLLQTDSGSLVLPGGAPLQLQLPSVDPGGVLVAGGGDLMRVPFGADEPVVLESGRSGQPSRPARVAGCVHAAWSGDGAWRSCDGEELSLPLEGLSGSPVLAFAVNGDRTMLNDLRSGAAWAVQSDGRLVDNWEDLLDQERTDEQVEQNDADQPEIDRVQVPPVAIDDEFGARPGRTSPLPVLLNDYDANGDVLAITDFQQLDPAWGTLELVRDRQQLQVALADSAAGTADVTYTVSDGRGGTATATVRLTVRAAGENSPPVQVRTTRLAAESSGRASVQVLGDWLDPDGDPMYLAGASVASPDSVSFEPEGEVLYADAGGGSGERTVIVAVSDLQDTASGTIEVSVRDPGEVPIVAEPFVVTAYAGTELVVEPLRHVRGGSGPLTLSSVPAKSGATVVPSYEKGTFRFTSAEVRTHYLEYVVTDGSQTATGIVRVDVLAAPEVNLPPVTVPKTVFVRSLGSALVQVAATDLDPGGGVLVLTALEAPPPGSGVRADVLAQSAVRVTLAAPLPEPITLGYRVSNGLADAPGTITIVEIPRPDRLQPPIARDDQVSVRVGDAVDIPVLANDEHPDGEALELVRELASPVTDGGGLLFATRSRLRYLAPATTGIYTAVYAVRDPSGQTAQAQVTITVKERDLATNAPPVPRTVVARVVAGESVFIEVPVTGIDPDGDSVQLIGQATNPQKGAVVGVEGNVLEYEAGTYSAGTDTFTYTVVDALGARATGTVRVGISPGADTLGAPVAVEDEVRVRPGRSVSVQVLANDSDPDGGVLRVIGVEPNEDRSTAEVLDASVVRVQPPDEPGRYGYVYTIENAEGGTASTFLTVIVDPEAPLAHPDARDTVLALSDVLNRPTVDVDVLANVFFAEGDVSELGLAVLPGHPTASVTPERRVRVTVQDDSQVIPFSVSHPEDDGVRSFAFIWVPGLDDALPQLDRTADPVVVRSGQQVTIELNDHIIAVGGKRVRLTDSSTVQATHSDGAPLVVDEDTLVFRSAERYFGPASISFEVTDGSSADDPDGRRATLVLPVRVDPLENQPPVFTGGAIDFEPGQQKTIDLLQLTDYPYADDLPELRFRVTGPVPPDFDVRLEGQQLILRADDAAATGTVSALTIGVSDAESTGDPGRLELRVVRSTRPLARPADDLVLARRGETTTVDVLANDEATNPFPGSAMRVVGIRGVEGGELPAGVSIEPGDDGRLLAVTVAEDAAAVDAHVQYQVEDATGDAARRVWGSAVISVQDVPDAPPAPERQGGFVGGELTVRITPPAFNNSPITGYTVVGTGEDADYSFDCGTRTICRLEGLRLGHDYRFQVVARNAIGASEPSPMGAPMRVDHLPGAPAAIGVAPTAADPQGGALLVTWQPAAVPEGGSAVQDYVVTVAGAVAGTVPAGETRFDTHAAGLRLPADTVVEVAVHARNGAQATDGEWLRAVASARTVGPPGAPSPAPAAAVANTEGHIRVTWGGSAPNGAGAVRYSVARVGASESTPRTCEAAAGRRVSPAETASGWVDTATQDGRNYVYVVSVDNGLFCRVFATGAVEAKRPPGQASGTVSVASSGAGQFDIFANGDLTAPGIVRKYQYRLSTDGVWRNLPSGRQLTSFADASVYGRSITVSVRACRDDGDGFCGPAGTAGTVTPVNTRVPAVSCVRTDPAQPPAITAPIAGEALPVEYLVSYGRDVAGVTVWGGFGEQSAGEPVPSDAIGIRVKARVTAGATTYEDPGYAESACR